MCNRIRLAGNGTIGVDLCRCGAIHLTVDSTTLRLDRDAYRELVSLLDEGVRAMDAQTLDIPTIH
jgi:hypothetical protein